MGWGEVVELWWNQREEEGGERDGGGGRGWESSSEWVRGPCPEVRAPGGSEAGGVGSGMEGEGLGAC